MTRGCFGALRLAVPRPIQLHACSATVQFLHSWAADAEAKKLEGRTQLSFRVMDLKDE